MSSDTTETKQETRVICFDNHLPIRVLGKYEDDEECWLGYVDRDFGGRYVRAYRNRKGEYLIWYRFNSPYTDGRSYNTYIGKFRPGTEDAMSKFPLLEDNDERGTFYTQAERNKIQPWLESLGLSKVEEFF